MAKATMIPLTASAAGSVRTGPRMWSGMFATMAWCTWCRVAMLQTSDAAEGATSLRQIAAELNARGIDAT